MNVKVCICVRVKGTLCLYAQINLNFYIPWQMVHNDSFCIESEETDNIDMMDIRNL